MAWRMDHDMANGPWHVLWRNVDNGTPEHVQNLLDMRVDMCVDMCIDMCADMCADMRLDFYLSAGTSVPERWTCRRRWPI